MNTLGAIIMILAMVPMLLVKKENLNRAQWYINPMLGVGLILIAIGNFIDGEMMGQTREYLLFTSYTRNTWWTLEDEPLRFVLSNATLLLVGLGFIFWRFSGRVWRSFRG